MAANAVLTKVSNIAPFTGWSGLGGHTLHVVGKFDTLSFQSSAFPSFADFESAVDAALPGLRGGDGVDSVCIFAKDGDMTGVVQAQGMFGR
jgi:hypothetical protein